MTTIIRNQLIGLDEEDEPPGKTVSVESTAAEEPPGSKVSPGRERFFGAVTEDCWNDWSWQYRHRITNVEELSRYIPLSTRERSQLKLVITRYPLSITPYYLSLINPHDRDDPIRIQAVPSFEEITLADMGEEDPLSEKEYSVVPGLVHRYPDRVLMVLTDLCPMLCRHCTRKREWRHGGWVRTLQQIEVMLDYIRNHRDIRDVIISGGDPLTLSTAHLEKVISRLRQIKHVEIIRIGSRFPVVLPQRIDDELCAMLSKYGPIWFNTHFNHYREITPEADAACDRLLRSGIPVNNQSVLLRGVNDSVAVQTKLCQGLLRIKVRPYYLFQCDEVQGTEHLRTPIEVGLKIIEGLRGHTSGLAVPTYVIDLPQGGGKVPLQPDYVLEHGEGGMLLKNYENHLFHYRNPRSNGRQRHAVEAAMPFASSLDSLTVEVKPEPQSEGVRDEDRVVVRP